MREKRPRRELCELLEAAGRRRAAAVAELDRTAETLGGLLLEARYESNLTLSKAAKIAGVSRPMAYKLMAKVGGSGT